MSRSTPEDNVRESSSAAAALAEVSSDGRDTPPDASTAPQPSDACPVQRAESGEEWVKSKQNRNSLSALLPTIGSESGSPVASRCGSHQSDAAQRLFAQQQQQQPPRVARHYEEDPAPIPASAAPTRMMNSTLNTPAEATTATAAASATANGSLASASLPGVVRDGRRLSAETHLPPPGSPSCVDNPLALPGAPQELPPLKMARPSVEASQPNSSAVNPGLSANRSLSFSASPSTSTSGAAVGRCQLPAPPPLIQTSRSSNAVHPVDQQHLRCALPVAFSERDIAQPTHEHASAVAAAEEEEEPRRKIRLQKDERLQRIRRSVVKWFREYADGKYGDTFRNARRRLSSFKSTTALNKLVEQETHTKKPWRIDPGGRMMGIWDLVTVVLLVFTATVTPYEVGFLETKLNVLFFLNRLVDLCFFADMVLNFFIPYQDVYGVFQHDLHKIASRYMRSWFGIDVVSILPYETLKFMGLDGLSNLKVLRVVRLIRLFKLLRVLRAGRMFSRWESRISINYAMLNLYGFIVSLVVICHWLACAWGVMINIDSLFAPEEDTWIDHYPYIAAGDSASRKYLAALYWAIATVTTLSYGDIVPHTDAERAFIILAMGIGGAVYAYIIGGVCGVLAGLNARSTDFHKKMDTLNEFLRGKCVDITNPELCMRLRDFYRFKHQHGNTAQDSASILSIISPSLRGEVASALHMSWLQKVTFFQGAEIHQDFYVRVALSLQTHLFSPREPIFTPDDVACKLHVLERGLIAIRGRILHRGDCFGHEVFYRPGTRWGYSAVTLSHGLELWLDAKDINNILDREEFSKVKRQTRKVVALLQTRDVVRRISKAVKSALWKETFEAAMGTLRSELGVKSLVGVPILVTLFLRRKYTQQQMEEIEAAARVLQGRVRRKQFAIKTKRDYWRAMEKTATENAIRDIEGALGVVDMIEYRDLLLAQRVTTTTLLKACTASELTLIGFPLGHAKKLVLSLREYGNDKSQHAPG